MVNSIQPYEGEIGPYQQYCEKHGLPLAASLSVALTHRTHLTLQQRLEAQLRLPWEKAGALVQCRNPLNQWQTALAMRWSREHGFPLDTMYCILQLGRPPTYNPLSIGWRQKAQADPRILKIARAVTVQAVGNGVQVTYQVEFWNGEVYSGVAMCDSEDRQVKERGTSAMAAIAETRAANRAYRTALRLPFNEIEEEVEA